MLIAFRVLVTVAAVGLLASIPHAAAGYLRRPPRSLPAARSVVWALAASYALLLVSSSALVADLARADAPLRWYAGPLLAAAEVAGLSALLAGRRRAG